MIPITFEERGPSAMVVRPDADRLDALVATDFRDAVLEHVAGRTLVVVDLTRVRFLDSSGLASLISVMKRLPPGAWLRLVGVNENIASVLRTTRLDRVFPIFGDLTQALGA